MQPVSRWAEITRWLETEGRLDVVDVAARLGVAQETIRRDLRSLEEQGQLHRVHGGAVPLAIHALPQGSVAPAEPAGSDDLELLEALWAWLPRDGTVLLGAGRLTTDLARVIVGDLPPSKGLTIVTNSLDAAIVLSRAATVSVYNIGGTVNAATRAQEGDWALQDLNRLHTDVSIVCPAGISVAGGLSQPTPAAAAVSESEVRCGRKVIALVDSSALGSSAFVQFAALDQIDQIAVTGFPDTSLVQPFVDRGVRVFQTPAMS